MEKRYKKGKQTSSPAECCWHAKDLKDVETQMEKQMDVEIQTEKERMDIEIQKY